MGTRETYAALALTGASPFVACALLLWIGVAAIPVFGRLDELASSYGLAIIAFVAGTHWSFQLQNPCRTPFNLFATSNIVFLATWLAFVTAEIHWAILIQIVAFACLLYIDYRLQQDGLISVPYLKVRGIATTVACISLLTITFVA